MDSLSNAELKTLLEALHIALRVTVVFPPLERSRLYTAIDELWARFGTEAIARGLTEYAEYYPEMEGVHSGTALDTGSEVEDAIAYHDNDRFWYALASRLAQLACQQVYGDQFSELPTKQRIAIESQFEQRANHIFQTTGIGTVINLNAIINKA